MPHRKQCLKGKCFHLFGFDILKKKRLEDAIHRNGGKVCTTVFKEVFFLDYWFSLIFLKNCLLYFGSF